MRTPGANPRRGVLSLCPFLIGWVPLFFRKDNSSSVWGEFKEYAEVIPCAALPLAAAVVFMAAASGWGDKCEET